MPSLRGLTEFFSMFYMETMNGLQITLPGIQFACG